MSNSISTIYTLQDYTQKINDRIYDIKKNYFIIGSFLLEVDSSELYLQENYDNISDYCEHVFGFKKTFTYDLMNVAKKFRGSTIFTIDEKYKNYSFSKLVIMSRMDKQQLSLCSPDYTVKIIRHIKKYRTDNLYDTRKRGRDGNLYYPDDANTDTSNSVHTENIYNFNLKSSKHLKESNNYYITLTLSRADIEELVYLLDMCKSDFNDDIEFLKSNCSDYSDISSHLNFCEELILFLNNNLANSDI